MIEIKARVDASAKIVGLDKYKLSKFPGVFHVLPLGTGIDGRYLTGFDPDAASVLSIPNTELRERKIKELTEIKNELERLSGMDLSANPNNPYWETQSWDISPRKLNMALWKDRVFYLAGLANKWFIKEEDFIEGDPKTHYTKFIASEMDYSEKKRLDKVLLFDSVSAKLIELFKQENKIKFRTIAQYLLSSTTTINLSTVKDGTLYEMLKDWVGKSEVNAEKFLAVAEKSPEDMHYKLKVDEAIGLGIIKIRDGYYQRGGITYGKTREDVVRFMSEIKNAMEFASLEEEIEEKLSLLHRYPVNQKEAFLKNDEIETVDAEIIEDVPVTKAKNKKTIIEE